MAIERRSRLLVFEDRLGFSDGYKGIWERLCNNAGMGSSLVRITSRSAYRIFSSREILEWKPPRKQPGFSSKPHVQNALRTWVKNVVGDYNPDGIICMDPALFFMCNPSWEQATVDRLRGGVYIIDDVPWLISFPISAYHSKAKPKDLAKLNDGFVEKGDFEEYKSSLDDGEESEDDDDDNDGPMTFERDSDDDKHVTRSMMQWHEPVIVPYGRIVLSFDLAKMGRILEKLRNHEKRDETRTPTNLLGTNLT